jgi:hypothetical protein
MTAPDELFAPDTGAAESPRLAWMRRHNVTTWQTPNYAGDVESPETGDTIQRWNASRHGHTAGMIQAPVTTGATEEEALTELAQRLGLKLWNEEIIPT